MEQNMMMPEAKVMALFLLLVNTRNYNRLLKMVNDLQKELITLMKMVANYQGGRLKVLIVMRLNKRWA